MNIHATNERIILLKKIERKSERKKEIKGETNSDLLNGKSSAA